MQALVNKIGPDTQRSPGSAGLSLPTVDLALPRSPVFGWSSLAGRTSTAPHSVDQLRTVHFTTSGRAALFLALHALALPAGSAVLVPTYHCPTMVAPILRAGLKPLFFGIGPDGLPLLERIDIGSKPRAMIVAHYFGVPWSLASVRAWCDRHHIALIEDCAHCYFGQAGERPVGAWGDFATASISKFFPVPEAGLLGSQARDLPAPRLDAPGLKAQVKGLVDVLEMSAQHRRLPGLNGVLQTIFRSKNRYRRSEGATVPSAAGIGDAGEFMRNCDMGRASQAPLWIALTLAGRVTRAPIIERRQANFRFFDKAFADRPGLHPLYSNSSSAMAPYVYPLWVDDADRVYQALRSLGAPVFRWDRIWPGTPSPQGDCGPAWSRHVLQLLCHQDLGPADVERVAQTVIRLAHPHTPASNAGQAA